MDEQSYDGPGSWSVHIRELGADRGADRGRWIGDYREADARAVAARIASERGGRVVKGENLSLRVVIGSRGGRPPVGPLVSHRMPADLVARLDAHAAATGTTRSELLRRGAELLLAQVRE